MDGLSLMEYLSGVDDKLKREADLFYRGGVAKRTVVKGVFRWAATAVMVVVMLGAFLLMLLVQQQVKTGPGGAENILPETGASQGESVQSENNAGTSFVVRIDKDGFETFEDSRQQVVYESYLKGMGSPVSFGEEAAAYTGGDPCDRGLTIVIPYAVQTWQSGDPGTWKYLYALRWTAYAFFSDGTGGGTIRAVQDTCDLAGLGFEENGEMSYWFPDPQGGEDSIREFWATHGDWSDENGMHPGSEFPGLDDLNGELSLFREMSSGVAQGLLESYLEQNGMTDWQIQRTDEHLEYYYEPIEPADPAWGSDSSGTQGFYPFDESVISYDIRTAAIEAGMEAVNQRLSYADPENGGGLAECFLRDLVVMDVADDGQSFTLSARFAFKPEHSEVEGGWWWAGNTKEGIGEYEGYLLSGAMLLVEEGENGWEVKDSGTNRDGWYDEDTPYRTVEYSLGRQLTPDDVRSLAKNGEALDWDDFSGFLGRETGSGIWIMRYEINPILYVLVGGSPDRKPDYVILSANSVDESVSIDLAPPELFLDLDGLDEFLTHYTGDYDNATWDAVNALSAQFCGSLTASDSTGIYAAGLRNEQVEAADGNYLLLRTDCVFSKTDGSSGTETVYLNGEKTDDGWVLISALWPGEGTPKGSVLSDPGGWYEFTR